MVWLWPGGHSPKVFGVVERIDPHGKELVRGGINLVDFGDKVQSWQKSDYNILSPVCLQMLSGKYIYLVRNWYLFRKISQETVIHCRIFIRISS